MNETITPTIEDCEPGTIIQRDRLTVFGFYGSENKDDKLGAWIAFSITVPDGARFVALREPTASEHDVFHGAPRPAEHSERTTHPADPAKPYRRSTVTHADAATFKANKTPVHHWSKVDPLLVLAYLDTFAGQEDDDEQIAAFVLGMAEIVGQGGTYRDAGMAGYAAFVEWADDQPISEGYMTRTLADIFARNAGQACLSVYKDGTWVVQGYLDACTDPGEPITTIELSKLSVTAGVQPAATAPVTVHPSDFLPGRFAELFGQDAYEKARALDPTATAA